jgi:hypothetical protein
MPRTPSACRSVSAVSAAVLLLAACSGGGGNDTSGSASEKSAAGTTAAAGDFCSRAADLDERVDAAVASRDDASVPDAFRDLATELRGIEPPAEIAADWETQADGLDQMADALAELDLTEPDSFAKLEELGAGLSTASDNVGTYLEANCGIDTSGSSAPAS